MNDYNMRLGRIRKFITDCNCSEKVWVLSDCLKMKELVDKATPKKPVEDKCPYCKESFGITHDILNQEVDYDYEENMEISYSVCSEENYFCSNCGQALDWSK